MKWVQLYEVIQNAGLVCRSCGISRPTLRKELKRYEQLGLVGLEDIYRRTHTPPNTKVTTEAEARMIALRKRNFGACRIPVFNCQQDLALRMLE